MAVGVIHELPLQPSELFAVKHRKFTFNQVFWLSGHPSGCAFPAIKASGLYVIQPLSPITAMGPPRILTVFRDEKTYIIVFCEGVKCQP